MVAGEIGPEYLQISEEELLRNAAESAQNTVLLNSGGVRRRPGSRPLAKLTGVNGRLLVFDLEGDDIRLMVMTDNRLMMYMVDGTLQQSLVAPWSGEEIADATIVNGDDKFYILGDFPSQELIYNEDTFTMGDLTFNAGIGGALRQPYYRFAGKGVTLQPSATSGNITIASNENHFVDEMIGTRVRYLQNEIEITGVTSPTSANGTVITNLYPTVSVTLSSAEPFKVGHVVTGDTTEIQGQISSVSGSSVTVTMLNGYTTFDIDEVLVSPEGRATVTAVAPSAPAASTIWDEQMISPFRGYPRTGAEHRNRLLLAGFPQAPNSLAASAIGFETDFDLGTARDSDAFIEDIGDDQNAEIRHLVSAEQLVIITDRGCYYVPESEQAPFTPTRVQFLRISPDGGLRVRPILTPEGVIFIDNAKRLLIIATTGSVRASWQVAELSRLAQHQIPNPKELTYVDGLGGRSERYIIVLNEDGNCACMSTIRGSDQAGFTPWVPPPGLLWLSFAPWKTNLYTILGNYLCECDFDAVLDLQCDFIAPCPILAGETVHISRSDQTFRGPMLVGADGRLEGGVAPAAELKLGKDFKVEIIPAPPVNNRIGWQRRRITRIWTDLFETGAFRIDDELQTGYDGLSDIEAAAPLQTGGQEPVSIWGYDPNRMPEITQEIGEGAPFLMRSMTLEVSY